MPDLAKIKELTDLVIDNPASTSSEIYLAFAIQALAGIEPK